MHTRPDERAPQDQPAFPTEAVSWLVGGTRRTVVSIAHRDVATALAAAGHHVAAVTGWGTPRFAPRSVDVIVATDRLPDDLEATAELLRPGGQLALVCNRRDQRIPWARKLDRLLGTHEEPDPASELVTCQKFGFVEEETFRYWQAVNHDSLAAMLRAELSDLDADTREGKVAQALDLYADYGRGNDGMQMPWVCRCFKATVVDKIWATPAAAEVAEVAEVQGIAAPGPADDSMLLIDFR